LGFGDALVAGEVAMTGNGRKASGLQGLADERALLGAVLEH
jgi:hypothetical protein